MKFGLTYDLRDDYRKLGYSDEETAEFDKEETIYAIESAIKAAGFKTERIGNIFALVEFLSAGKTSDMVFNIAEGMYGAGREAQIPALLDAYRVDYVFSDTVILALTLHKALTKKVIRDSHIPTADFFCVYDITDLEKMHLHYPLFAKPVAEGTGKGIGSASFIEDREQLESAVAFLLEKFNQPVLVEEYLPGREFTVGITGTGKNAEVIGGMEILFEKGVEESYSYENKANYKSNIRYSLIKGPIEHQVYSLALDAWRALECRDGGRIDIRCDTSGRPNFIEVNPLAGLNPDDSDLPIICRMNGISYNELISKIINSAISRKVNR